MLIKPSRPVRGGQDSYCYLSELSPKDKPWDIHRAEAESVMYLYRAIEYAGYADRMQKCSQRLLFWLQTCDDHQLRCRLFSARFCRVRHCPVCQWRKTLMWRARFFTAVPRLLEDYPTARFVFLTLTVRNCAIAELKTTITFMNQAWKRLVERKVFPAEGFIKSVEVTRNQKDGSAHPHFHCLLMVPSNYFGRNYINQSEWTELWKSCLRINYTPVVNVKAIRPKKNINDSHEALMISLCETLKYTVKPETLLSDGQWLGELTRQLHNTRSVAVGGIFKKYISDDEPEDLIHADDENSDEDELDEHDKLIFDWASDIKRYVRNTKL